MTLTQFITTIVILLAVVATSQFLYARKKRKDSLVELKAKFYVSENTDNLIDDLNENTGVEIAGVLGNDLMVNNDYIIDYKQLVVKHKLVKISIKVAMDIIEMPLIVLWQNTRKYIFLLDTGATSSIIHSKTLEHLRHHELEDDKVEIHGYGGSGQASKSISTSLFYAKNKIQHKPL